MQQGQVTITTPTPSGAPEGHDAAMVARYEAGQAAAAAGLSSLPPTDAAAAPAAAPAGAPAAAPAAPAAATPEAPAAPSGDFVDNLLTSAGLTRDSLAQEYLAGGLSDKSYAALAAKGVNREAVDQYLNGLKAQAETANAEYESAVIKATVGTPEKYAEVTAWAATALTPAEKAAFNEAVSSGDQARAAFAIAGLNARFATANPAEPQLLNQGVPAGGPAAFESWAQVRAEMQKPEYKTDPAFREKVKQRLAVSPDLS